MNSSVLSDLCLICSNFGCQAESFHKKYTFLQLESLLVKNTLLNVSLQKKLLNQPVYLSQISSKDINYASHHQKDNQHCKISSPINEISRCVQKIQSSFQKVKSSQFKEMKQLESLILASLSTIQFMESIKTNSLLYHDILQILKLVAFLKFSNEENFMQNKALPFTQKRIQRTIKQLKLKIQTKKEQSKTIQQNNCFQSSNHQNILSDLTNKALRQNWTFSNNKKTISSHPCSFDQQNQSFILAQILNQHSIVEQITQNLESLSNSHFLRQTQLSMQVFQNLFHTIQTIESIFVQRLENPETIKIKQIKQLKSCFSKKLDENKTYHNDRSLLNPEKSFYPIMKNLKPQKQRKNAELPQTIQFAYIEGIPFPTNRRSIDFSMLELTDELLLNYLPALEKLKDLQELCIRKNKLTPISYQLLKNTFPRLRSIDLRQNIITQQIVQILLCFKHLNILYLSECQINPVSLIKVCINMQGLNVLYCDRLTLIDTETEQTCENIKPSDSDLRGIFYIMCLNLKKLMYFSLKGYFSEEAFKYGTKCNSSLQKKIQDLPEQKLKEINIFSNIYQTFRKRHGILEI